MPAALPCWQERRSFSKTCFSGDEFSYPDNISIGRRSFGKSARVWGDAPDGPGDLGLAARSREREKVLRRAVELGVNLIDTADAYGPETDELLIAEALYPYPKGLVIATKGGTTRPGPGSWVPNGRPEYLSQCVDKVSSD